jgi:hypothetical protein
MPVKALRPAFAGRRKDVTMKTCVGIKKITPQKNAFNFITGG